MPEPSEWIFETTDEHFVRDVLDRSQLGLVVVDFWAEWCGPCRMLGPLLEKLTNEAAGSFTLVKADTEQCPQAASQFGVAGIPAVYAVLEGQVVDSFQGALPEPQLKSWCDRLTTAATLIEVQQISDDNPQDAQQKLQTLLDANPEHAEALIALAEIQLKQEQIEECTDTIEKLEARGYLEPVAEKIKTALSLHSKSSVDVAAARAAADERPGNFELQITLAEALVGQQQYTDAFGICLELVSKDRANTGEKARQLMVDVFQVMTDDELVSEYRRKLSMLLY